jgi:hypothetical protein
MQAPAAAVHRVATAFDHAASFQAVHQAGDADGLYFEDFGKFFLQQAGAAIDVEQDLPLRARHAVGAGAFIGLDADEARQGDDGG